MGDKQIIKKGRVFLVSCEEYSDTTDLGLYKALRDIDVEWLQKRALRYHSKGHGKIDYQKFDNWLWKRSRLVRNIPCASLHLGSYGEADFQL